MIRVKGPLSRVVSMVNLHYTSWNRNRPGRSQTMHRTFRTALSGDLLKSLVVIGVVGLLPVLPATAQMFSISDYNSGEPIEVSADSLDVDSESRDVTLYGSVQVMQGELTVRADTMVVHYNDDGDGNRVESIRANGDVVVLTDDGTAHGDAGLWSVASGIVILEQNVRLVNDDAVLTGTKVTLDLASGQVNIVGGEERVNILLSAVDEGDQ